MKLPHLKPVKFADKILNKNETQATVKCSFPYIPTLGMLSEAAAQSSCAFANDNNIGFLTSLKNIEFISNTLETHIIIKIEKSMNIGNINEFKFEIYSLKKDKIAKGYITIMIQNEMTENE